MSNQQVQYKVNSFEPSTAVYTPPEVAKSGKDQVAWIKSQQHRALHFFIPGIDQYFAPLLPGQVCIVIGQTSHYKSSFAHAWEDFAARQLMDQGRNDEVIVHVSVEEGIEEQAMLMFGRETGEDSGEIARGQVQDWSKLEQAAIKVGIIPIYRIGDSLARAEDFPNLYLSNMVRSINHLQKELLVDKKQVAAIFFDYLQAFPIDPEVRTAGQENQRRLQVRSDMYRLRYCAAYFKCPVVVLVQAKQKLDGTNGPMKIPGIYDGEETSTIAQRADRAIQLWLPKMTYPVGHQIDYNNWQFIVEENLLFVKVGKQRGRLPSGKTWKCRIDYVYNRILQEILPGVDQFGDNDYSHCQQW